MGGKKYFTYPKPIKLVQRAIQLYTESDSLILDFFSGSATTAHAVMQQNVEDDGNRKFIMVQLPEQLDEKSEAYKDGYCTIPDIAEERIRRAGYKIISENPLFADKLDTGFKVFELDKSNIRKWNTDPDKLAEQLQLGENNLIGSSGTDDLVYEIMLKQGLELTLPIEKETLGQTDIYKIAYGALFIVLGTNITTEVADRIIEVIKAEDLEDVSVVLQDTGFLSDNDKLNMIETLNANGVDYKNILSI
ncbi:DNA methyltransferase [Bombilactobacillus folatiphilus]|uniref:DNA methyltransferase n=1 Tax=Bombilactobacillus folatiphilus TaxID=2923362 RepID=UPI00294FF499|nr:DNA methyltransferase [Bombilactobacillus folatiphilus]